MAKVELLHHTPLGIAAHAIRTCWQSHERGDDCGPKDRELMLRVGNKFKHASTLEHVTYNFYVSDISRALLQELARHRIASLSVKSTRYTLKELKEIDTIHSMDEVEQFCVLTGDSDVDDAIAAALKNLQKLVKKGIPNDITKFALPDAYKTELTWSINMRSLQNFIRLRTDKAAMWEIRELATAVYMAVPDDHKFMLEEFVYDEGREADTQGH